MKVDRGPVPGHSHSADADHLHPTEHGSSRKAANAQPLHVAQIADALLTMKTSSAVSSLSVPTLYRKAATDPTFPKLIKLGRRCTRIRAGDLTAWLAAQAAS